MNNLLITVKIKNQNTKHLLEDQDKDTHQKLLTQCKPAPTVSPKGSQMYIITEVIRLGYFITMVT